MGSQRWRRRCMERGRLGKLDISIRKQCNKEYRSQVEVGEVGMGVGCRGNRAGWEGMEEPGCVWGVILEKVEEMGKMGCRQGKEAQ